MATLLCLSPQTKSIICSIIPAGQGPASLQNGWWDAQAVASTPAPRLCPAGGAGSAGSLARPVSGRRGPTRLQHPGHQLPSASCGPHPFPLLPVPRGARHSRGTGLGERQGCVWMRLGPLVACPHHKPMAKPLAPRPPPPVDKLGELGGRRAAPVERRGLRQRSQAAHQALSPRRDNERPALSRGDTARPSGKSHRPLPGAEARPWPPTWHVPTCP